MTISSVTWPKHTVQRYGKGELVPMVSLNIISVISRGVHIYGCPNLGMDQYHREKQVNMGETSSTKTIWKRIKSSHDSSTESLTQLRVAPALHKPPSANPSMRWSTIIDFTSQLDLLWLTMTIIHQLPWSNSWISQISLARDSNLMCSRQRMAMATPYTTNSWEGGHGLKLGGQIHQTQVMRLFQDFCGCAFWWRDESEGFFFKWPMSKCQVDKILYVGVFTVNLR